MYFSKSFTRLLDFSDRFCTISSGCYRIFLHFHCIFPARLLHRHSLFLAVAPGFLHVPTDFAWLVPSIFLWSLSCFAQVSLYFPMHPLRGFSICFVQHFFTTCFLSFSPLSSIGFCTISSGFLHFHTFSILILIQEFYLSPSFSDPFCTISSRCYHIFLHFHCIFPACLLHRHGLRLAFAPVSSIFQGIFHGLFLAFAPFSSVFQGILYDFLWSLSCSPAVSLYFPIHPHGLSGHQKGGSRGNRYPTVSKLPSGT